LSLITRVETKILIILFSSTLALGCHGSAIAQNNDYSKVGITTGLSVFEKGSSYETFGNYSLNHKNSIGYFFGLTLEVYRLNNLSINTGLNWGHEPILKYDIHYLAEDVFPEYGNFSTTSKYKQGSYTIPLQVNQRIPIKSNSGFIIFGGLNLSFIPQSSGDYYITIVNKDGSQSQEVYKLTTESAESQLRSSIFFGSGYEINWGKALISLNGSYTLYFKPTVSGEYRFDNLFVSPPSGGKYKLSGNYFRVALGVRLLKSN